MRTLLTLLILAAALGAPAVAEEPRQATLYKNPQCGCCEGHADYLRENGFEVTVEPTRDLPLLHRQYGVPSRSGLPYDAGRRLRGRGSRAGRFDPAPPRRDGRTSRASPCPACRPARPACPARKPRRSRSTRSATSRPRSSRSSEPPGAHWAGSAFPPLPRNWKAPCAIAEYDGANSSARFRQNGPGRRSGFARRENA